MPHSTCSRGHEEASWYSSGLPTTLHTISDFLSTLSDYIRELQKAFVAPIFVMTLSLLIETAESFALRHSYLSMYASRHHMCSRRSLAPAATVPTTSHGTPSLVSFAKEKGKMAAPLLRK